MLGCCVCVPFFGGGGEWVIGQWVGYRLIKTGLMSNFVLRFE